MLNNAISLGYYGRHIKRMFFEEYKEEKKKLKYLALRC